MSSNELEVKIKIGEIEFYAKGQTDAVEAQRQNFTNIVLPAAVEAIKNSRLSQAYVAETITPALEATKEVAVVDNYTDLSRMSVNEFINNKGFKSQIDIAIGLIYYNEKGKGCTDFSRDDLIKYFKDARISPQPKNPSDVINKLIAKTLIMSTADKKRYCLTQSGICFVDEFVSKETKKKKTTSFKSGKKQVKQESVYSQLSPDDLNRGKYPDIKLFKDFKERMMVVLYILKEEGLGEEFSIYDVQVILTDILGFPATENQIQGVFRRHTTWFKKTADSNNSKIVKRRLLNDAIEFAKGLIAGKANSVE